MTGMVSRVPRVVKGLPPLLVPVVAAQAFGDDMAPVFVREETCRRLETR